MSEKEEMAEFLRTHYSHLVGSLSLYCGNTHIAEELAQDVAYRICRDWKLVARADNPTAWVHRMAINCANSYFRRKKAERRATERLIPSAQTESEASRTELQVVVRQAVASLPKRQKTCVILRFFVGLNVAETATVMQCPEGTVKTLTHRALAKLRECYDPEDSEEVRNAI